MQLSTVDGENGGVLGGGVLGGELGGGVLGGVDGGGGSTGGGGGSAGSPNGAAGGGDGEADGGGLLSQKHAKKALVVSTPVWSTSLTRHWPSSPACSYASQMNCADALLSKPLHDVYAHGARGGCSGGGGETGGAGGDGGAGSSGGAGGGVGGGRCAHSTLEQSFRQRSGCVLVSTTHGQ